MTYTLDGTLTHEVRQCCPVFGNDPVLWFCVWMKAGLADIGVVASQWLVHGRSKIMM
jgi:hypothetical protein